MSAQASNNRGPKIAIIGAGPAGLTLAYLLRHNDFRSVKIFDLRKRPEPDSLTYHNFPAGPVALQTDGGLAALEACGLFEELQAVCLHNSGCIVADKHAEHIWSGNDVHGDSQLFLRNDIICLMSDRLKDILPKKTKRIVRGRRLANPVPVSQYSNIHFYWMSKLGLSYGKADKWRLVIDQKGETEDFDIVVGADGAHSGIRQLITNQGPVPSGIHCISLTIPGKKITNPAMAIEWDDLLGQSTFYASESGKAVICKRGFENSILIYLMLLNGMVVDPDTKEVSSYDALEDVAWGYLENTLLESPRCFGDWSPKIKDLIREGFKHDNPDNPYAARKLFTFEPDFQWDHVSGLTLIGDAAHVMTHFSGDGVDLAMKDALELSEDLIAEREKLEPDWDAALVRFEERMFKRIPDNGRKAAETMLAMFDERAPDSWIDLLKDLEASSEVSSEASGAAI